MPQPAEVEALTAELLNLYQASWERIQRLERAIVDDWTRLNRTRRLGELRALRAVVEQRMDHADSQALTFVQDRLPTAYAAGIAAATVVPFTGWDDAHRETVTRIADDTYRSLLDATRFVRESTKDLIRTLAKEHVADKVIRGQTAVQSGRDLARVLEGHGITAVVYKNGSRHGLAEYADVVVRTKTAEAYSTATLTQLRRGGIGYVEVFDGAGCGWIGHGDPDKAAGSFRTVDESLEAPLSHPRCQRSFGGRPDVTTEGDARRAQPSTTPGQRADQAASEQARAIEQAFRRQGGRLSDAGQRVRAARHASVLSRRAAVLQRRAARVSGR